jgi:hypothetical protein
MYAMFTSIGFQGLSSVISTTQFSISHRVGTRELKNVVVPFIENGIAKFSPDIPISLAICVESSDTVHP